MSNSNDDGQITDATQYLIYAGGSKLDDNNADIMITQVMLIQIGTIAMVILIASVAQETIQTIMPLLTTTSNNSNAD